MKKNHYRILYDDIYLIKANLRKIYKLTIKIHINTINNIINCSYELLILYNTIEILIKNINNTLIKKSSNFNYQWF